MQSFDNRITQNMPMPHVPALRFPEFSSKWQAKKLKDTGRFVENKSFHKTDDSQTNKRLGINFIDLCRKCGGVITDISSNTDLNEWYKCQLKDILMPAISNDYKELGKASIVLCKDTHISNYIHVFRVNEQYNPIFVSYLINAYRNNLLKLVNGTSVCYLSPLDIANVNIFIPSSDEQQKIAEFLLTIDKQIKVLQKMRMLLTSYKEGVLQQISKQILRFRHDDDGNFPDWQPTTLGEIGTFLTVLPESNNDATKNQLCITCVELIRHYDEIIKNVSKTNVQNGIESESGDILIPSLSIDINDLGKASVLLLSKGIKIGHHIHIFRLKKGYDSVFVSYLINAYRTTLLKYVNGASLYHLASHDIAKLIVLMPSLEEQQKIAAFLSKLYARIELVNDKIEHIERLKKSLLQQMFVK